jgi:hypothetical protein
MIVETIEAKGMYAPKTNSNNYFVYLNNSTKVLAHNYAHLQNPTQYELFVDIIYKTWNMFDSAIYEKQIHPVFVWLSKKFTFLLK